MNKGRKKRNSDSKYKNAESNLKISNLLIIQHYIKSKKPNR